MAKKTIWYRKSAYSGSIYTYKTDDIDYLIFRKDKNITEIHFKIPGTVALLKEKFNYDSTISSQLDIMGEEEDLLKILKLYDKK